MVIKRTVYIKTIKGYNYQSAAISFARSKRRKGYKTRVHFKKSSSMRADIPRTAYVYYWKREKKIRSTRGCRGYRRRKGHRK